VGVHFVAVCRWGGAGERERENERTRERENERGEIIRVETSPKDIVDS